jgi:16S rRNA pseudouridine516 synthase
MALEQLERILRSQGFGSKKDCRAIARQGVVTVNGELADDPFAYFTVDEGVPFHFTVRGTAWTWTQQATVVLNKPAGVECSRNPIHHPSVLTLLPDALVGRGVQPVGRLDEDTTGLLILTDDGQLNHKLSSPKRKLPKVYEATCKHEISDDMLAALLAGVVLHDDPETVTATGAERIDSHRLKLTIVEGKYHQVKRMVAAAGNRVEALSRRSLGNFTLPADLAPGEWRWMSADEIACLLGEKSPD